MSEGISILADIASIIGVFGIMLTLVFLIYQVKQWKKENFVNIFLAYTKRFDEIYVSIQEKKDYITYFNFCSEEYFLYKEQYIPIAIWESWCSGIRDIMGKKDYREAWEKNRETSWYNKDFISFMDDISCKKEEELKIEKGI